MNAELSTSDQVWLTNLQRFIYDFLSAIIPDPTKRLVYINRDNMVIWARAFTHESISYDFNYEELEFLGDALLKGVFSKYLVSLFPRKQKDELTELVIHYTNKMYLGPLSRRLQFDRHVRIASNYTDLNTAEDLFESFMGALCQVSDSIFFGLGFANCYNLIVSIFAKITIDEAFGAGSEITLVIQIFTRFKLGSPIETVDHVNNQTVYTVSLGPNQVNFLVQHGINAQRLYQNPILGTGRASSKPAAKHMAYVEAFNNLKTLGVTPEWSATLKFNLDINTPEIQQIIDAVNNKVKRQGYRSFYFVSPKNLATSTSRVTQVIGVRADGTRERLVSLKLNKNVEQSSARYQALTAYLNTN